MLPLPGTYAMIFTASQEKLLAIGKLGSFQLKPGYYVYVGSAFGPGGLKARIARHRQISSRFHWHIDYLKAHLHPDEVWYTNDPISREHQWSQALARLGRASVPLPGFGSSDCRCETHLYYFSFRPSVAAFRRKVHAAVVAHSRILIENFLDKNNISDIH